MSNLGVRSLRTGPSDGAAWKTALQDLVTDLGVLRTPVNATVTDVGAVRTTTNALVTDLTAVRTTSNNLVTDATAVRTAANQAVADLTALYATVNALVTDFVTNLTKNRATTSGALAPGTTAGKVKSVSQIDYLIANTGKQKAATDDLWNLTAVTTAANGFAKVLLQLDASGTATIKKGTESTVSQAAAVFPAADADTCVVGWVELGNSYAGGALNANQVFNGTSYEPTAAAPAAQTSSAAAALTASAAAALTASAAAAQTASAAAALVSTFTDVQ